MPREAFLHLSRHEHPPNTGHPVAERGRDAGIARPQQRWQNRVCLPRQGRHRAIHFAYEAPWIFGRTSPGAKLLTLAHNQWCAFETDEVRGLSDWESVVVKGPFSPQNSPMASWNYSAALAALRSLQPSTFTVDDPTPYRDVVFAIHATEMSGRCSVSSGSAEEPPAVVAGASV
jgi:hypothetical protein